MNSIVINTVINTIGEVLFRIFSIVLLIIILNKLSNIEDRLRRIKLGTSLHSKE